MQALQWAVSHPRFMGSIVAMTPMAKTAPWAALVVQTARACLMADPAWNGTEFERVPERGWRAYAGLMSALLMRTPGAVAGLDFENIVAQHKARGFDAHDYLYQSWAYEAHDIGAPQRIEARTLILAPPLDLFNPAESARAAAAAIAGARFVEIPSRQGHLAAGDTDPEDAAFLNRTLMEFLR
jgi:homoserine O-acetyltransferase